MHGKVFTFPFFLGEILSECMRRATKLSDRKFNELEKNIVDYQHLQCKVLRLFTKERAANKRESSCLNGIDNEMNDSLTMASFPLKGRYKYSVYYDISFSRFIYFVFYS